MASNPTPIIATNKNTNSKAALSPSQFSSTQNQSVSNNLGEGQRRSGGSGSFGAGLASRNNTVPRNIQSAKKQNKNSKRFARLDDTEYVFSDPNTMRSSRKGTSITHLMNYAVPGAYYAQGQRYNNNHNRHVRSKPTWGPGSGYHASDKARFVHANYRFIVDPRCDYRMQAADADIHLDWSNVLQILVSSQSQAASCPICLGTPVAPRMARCGHIFCLPCLIRYMHSEDAGNVPLPEFKARSQKCPICFDSIYTSECRPARLYTGQEGEEPREGSDVVLRLVMRPANSTLALPRDGADVMPKEEEVPWYNAAEVMDYVRIMKGTEDYMNEQFEQEIRDLGLQEQEDELMFGEDSAEWSHRAVRAVRAAKEKVKGIGGAPVNPKAPSEPKVKRPAIPASDPSQAPDMYQLRQAYTTTYSESPSIETTIAVDAVASNSAHLVTSSQRRPSHGTQHANLHGPRRGSMTRPQHHQQHPPSEYYFYQALLHYYLSPLDIRILRDAFGDFSNFPSTILPRVERVSTGHVVDDDLRRRLKYLAHLPYGCEVNFLECDWTDTVPADKLEKFKPEIEKRRKRNQDKEVREEKARVKAEKDEEDARYAHLRRRRVGSSGEPEAPFKLDDFQPLTPSEALEAAEAIEYEEGEGHSTSPPYPRRQGSGFASLASMSTSPSTSRTVWGTPAISGISPSLYEAIAEQDARDDGWLQGWERDMMHEEDVFLAQAQALSMEAESSTGPHIGGSSSAGGGGGKKKKQKKITLMSTTARRGA